MSKPVLDRKRPEPVRAEAIRESSERPAAVRAFP
jgi:hypothetical protein